MSGWTMSSLAKALLAIAILVVIALILYTYTKEPIAEIFGWKLPVQEIKYGEEDSYSFFTQIHKNYENCKKSQDTNCYCNINFELIPKDYTLEIENSEGVSFFRLWKGPVYYSAYTPGRAETGTETVKIKVLQVKYDGK